MIKHFTQTESIQFEVLPPLYLPFYNIWGTNAYSTYLAFSYDPFNLRAVSTSGSPVVICQSTYGGGAFFGFMNESGGRFEYDGAGILTITCEAGQTLYFNEDCAPYDEWSNYNRLILLADPNETARHTEKFWDGLEYCTWVDQKHEAALMGIKNVWRPLTEDYVYNYMRRVDKLGLPKGKLTIDDGWDDRYCVKPFEDGGTAYHGNWDIDRTKFKNMECLVRDMKDEGFYPGLWFAPFTISPNSRLAEKHPELVGENYIEGSTSTDPGRRTFIELSPVLEDYYREIFTPYIEMGFLKFKLDMGYGPKAHMKELLRLMNKVIKSVNPAVEVECHIPDIFVSRHCDIVRINDVAFDEEQKWRSVTYEHYRVCRYSAAARPLNLDHIGTNTPTPTAEEYLAHCRLLTRLKGGFPCVSLLPDRFDAKVSDEFAGMVNEWHKEYTRAAK